MVERTYPKSEVSEAQIREALHTWNPKASWMFEDQGDRWRLLIQELETGFDEALADVLVYPDPAVAVEVQVVEMLKSTDATVLVSRNGQGLKRAALGRGVNLSNLRKGDSMLMAFKDGDRSKGVVIG